MCIRDRIWTFLSLSGAERVSSAALERSVDLSEFTGGMTIHVSVKALAEKDSVMYKDGPAGVIREMELPSRLPVPDVADLAMAEKYSTEEYMTIDAMNDDGLHLTMAVSYTHLDVYKRQVCGAPGERRHLYDHIQRTACV